VVGGGGIRTCGGEEGEDRGGGETRARQWEEEEEVSGGGDERARQWEEEEEE